MRKLYAHAERIFEKVVTFATIMLGNSITFILALCLVIYWLLHKEFYLQNLHECIRDVIHGITFLSLFIIQKSFNKFAASLHVKVNELVVTHEPANNAVINAEEKTERELIIMAKEYADLIDNDKPEE
ncbi:MAG: low affinity iron permease family protein [Bacteroidetes bacterium]|nr:low affinity iron permease family protein [Bacteroidota bacterium]